MPNSVRNSRVSVRSLVPAARASQLTGRGWLRSSVTSWQARASLGSCARGSDRGWTSTRPSRSMSTARMRRSSAGRSPASVQAIISSRISPPAATTVGVPVGS